jgi:hypothetical protein
VVYVEGLSQGKPVFGVGKQASPSVCPLTSTHALRQGRIQANILHGLASLLLKPIIFAGLLLIMGYKYLSH